MARSPSFRRCRLRFQAVAEVCSLAHLVDHVGPLHLPQVVDLVEMASAPSRVMYRVMGLCSLLSPGHWPCSGKGQRRRSRLPHSGGAGPI